MKRFDYQLTQDYIELNHLLKHCGFADSGGSGGTLVSSGVVSVNGVIELRKRNKIRAGMMVEVGGAQIHVSAAAAQ